MEKASELVAELVCVANIPAALPQGDIRLLFKPAAAMVIELQLRATRLSSEISDIGEVVTTLDDVADGQARCNAGHDGLQGVIVVG